MKKWKRLVREAQKGSYDQVVLSPSKDSGKQMLRAHNDFFGRPKRVRSVSEPGVADYQDPAVAASQSCQPS